MAESSGESRQRRHDVHIVNTSLDIPTEIPLVIGSASDGEPYPQPKGRMRAFLDALLSTVSIFGGDVDIPNDPVERESMF